MIYSFKGKKIEICDFDKNRDGSKFVIDAYYLDKDFTPLTEEEISALNEVGQADGWQ